MQHVFRETQSPFSLAIDPFGGTGDIPGNGHHRSGFRDEWHELCQMGRGHQRAECLCVRSHRHHSSYADFTLSADSCNHPQSACGGPSFAFSTPYPETNVGIYGSLFGNLGSYASTIQSNSDLNNVHLYPTYSGNAFDYTNSSDIRYGALDDVNQAFDIVLPGLPVINTEYQPTLLRQGSSE
ncbi:MAG: hypothetical protein WDO13_12145 [Verrucomicrobiota bacterium]